MADSQVKSGNLLPPRQGIEVYGVKFTILSDGKVCANGTPTQEYAFSIAIPANISGDYYFSGCPSGGSYSSYDVFMYDKTAAARPKMWDGTTASLSDFGDSANNQVKIVAGHETEFRIRVRQGYELRNVIFSPYLREPTSPPHYMPYSSTGWYHSFRKLTTATELVENPLYSDGTAITAYTIKGNTVQDGTPTPSNPVEVNGVGVRTENLFNVIWESGSLGASGGAIADTNAIRTKSPISCEAEKTYTFVPDIDGYDSIWVNYYGTTNSRERIDTSGGTFITPQDCEQVRFRVTKTNIGVEPVQQYNAMFNEGSAAKPYEPDGYKIPISNGGVTTNIYLGSTQTVRQIKKLVLTGEESGWFLSGTNSYGIANYGLPNALISFIANIPISTHFVYQTTLQSDTKTEGIFTNAQLSLYVRVYAADLPNKTAFVNWLKAQYAAGTPVTVWYVLATPTTAAVNEPLMKIGTYADTLSNAASIPTTEGANSITVDTTVQPSEFTATWAGWHDSSVKEWDGSDWQ